jgi:hypothetical protein
MLAMAAAVRKAMGLFGSRLTPRLLVDAVIRLGTGGDRFGLRRGGLTFARLVGEHPHGTVLASHLRAGVLADTVVYRGRKYGCATGRSPTKSMRWACAACRTLPAAADRDAETRSENSWMHNSPLLMSGERTQRALMHVDDAAELHIEDGDVVLVSSEHGEIEVSVTPPRTSWSA